MAEIQKEGVMRVVLTNSSSQDALFNFLNSKNSSQIRSNIAMPYTNNYYIESTLIITSSKKVYPTITLSSTTTRDELLNLLNALGMEGQWTINNDIGSNTFRFFSNTETVESIELNELPIFNFDTSLSALSRFVISSPSANQEWIDDNGDVTLGALVQINDVDRVGYVVYKGEVVPTQTTFVAVGVIGDVDLSFMTELKVISIDYHSNLSLTIPNNDYTNININNSNDFASLDISSLTNVTGVLSMDLSNNTSFNSNDILSQLVSKGWINGFLNVQNCLPLNAQGLIDKATLESNGWVVLA